MQIGHRLAVARHRPEIALLHHPAHVLLGLRADPDRVGAAEQQPIGLRVRDDAARSRDHRALVLRDNALEAGAFMPPEGGEPRHLDQQRHARAVFLLDHAVELDERHAELFGQHLAERGFAGAAQADQRDPPAAIGRPRRDRSAARSMSAMRRQIARRHAAEQIDDPRVGRGNAAGLRQQFEHRHFQRVGDGAHHQHRRIAGAAFDLRQIALRGSAIPAASWRRDMPRLARPSRTMRPTSPAKAASARPAVSGISRESRVFADRPCTCIIIHV